MEYAPFAHLTPEELNTLGRNHAVYRDRFCDGWAKMNVEEFYKKHGLMPYAPPRDESGDLPPETFGNRCY